MSPALPSNPVATDRPAKRRRLLALLEHRGADSIVLRSHPAVAWYLDEARTHVSLAGDPVAAVVVHRNGDELRLFDNEADRPTRAGRPLSRTAWIDRSSSTVRGCADNSRFAETEAIARFAAVGQTAP